MLDPPESELELVKASLGLCGGCVYARRRVDIVVGESQPRPDDAELHYRAIIELQTYIDAIHLEFWLGLFGQPQPPDADGLDGFIDAPLTASL